MKRRESSSPHGWMRALASHYADIRRRHPGDPLLIVFDIDGTILDLRHMIHHVLLAYDREHGTEHFLGLMVEDIHVHENDVGAFLADKQIAAQDRARILKWYMARRWSTAAARAAHRPYRGVLDIMRWFQIQPHTHIALNTDRPEAQRADTLKALNALGREYRVRFHARLLHMAPNDCVHGIEGSKAAGLRRFQSQGFRILAAIDSDPINIESMARTGAGGETLFLRAETLFQSRLPPTPRAGHGRKRAISAAAAEDDLPSHVQLVWHNINNENGLEQFLASPIRWGEADIRRDQVGRIVLRHESFDGTPWYGDETLLTLSDLLKRIRLLNKGLKLDLKEGGGLVDRVLGLLRQHGIAGRRLWFNGTIETLGEKGFRRLAATCPDAIVQCPVDFLAPMLTAMPEQARELLRTLDSWGVNRFSMSWNPTTSRKFFEQLEAWGYDIDIYGIRELESYLQAALMQPRSLTADFGIHVERNTGRGVDSDRAWVTLNAPARKRRDLQLASVSRS